MSCYLSLFIVTNQMLSAAVQSSLGSDRKKAKDPLGFVSLEKNSSCPPTMAVSP